MPVGCGGGEGVGGQQQLQVDPEPENHHMPGGAAQEKKKKEKKRERNSDTNESPSSSGETREFRRQNEKLGFTYFEFRDKTNFQWKSNRQLEIGEHIYAKSKISDTDLIACTLSEQIN